MRKILTNQHMLRAAQKMLAEHIQTRPATKAEATQIAQHHRIVASAHTACANALRLHRNACLIALQEDRLAANEIMHAEAWERVAAGPEGEAWEQTRIEYEGRVRYYAGLINATASM